jgi:hypothetical protein
MINEMTLTEGTLPLRDETETASEKTPGGEQEVQWKTVAVAQGLAEASIISGRLETEGLPTRVHQESAGVVYGLTVGRLGEARVLVPAPLLEQARKLLSQTY